ncbi:DUF4232 domain-containing protein [Streptoalloteichus tenebrarius]
MTILLAGLALAGCGPDRPPADTAPPTVTTTGGGGTTTATGGSGPTTAPDGGPAPTSRASEGRCDARTLSGVVEMQDSGAGNRYARLVVTNTGDRPCTLQGYAGMELRGKDRSPLATNVERADNPGPQFVRLAPGGRAAANLRWGVVPGAGEPEDRPCQPEPAEIAVIPPDETQPFTVTWSYGPVCQHGRISTSAFFPL